MDNTAPPTAPGGGPSLDEPPTSQRTYDDSGPRVTTAQMKDLSRLRRSVTDRHVAGVAGGLARHLDVDPILIRVAFVIGSLFGGAGILVYLAVWFFVPEEGTEDQPLGLDERTRVGVLIAAGVLALLAALGDWAGAYWFPWPVAVLAVAALWFLQRDRKPRTAPQPYGAPPHAGHAPDDAAGPMPTIDYSRIPPRNPRKRGPILFWFTMALIALGIGVLGVIDLAGVAVTPSAYPALALGTTAVMLLVGAFWGRAGGLIVVGLAAALATGVISAGNHWADEAYEYEPTVASQVRPSYDVAAGTLVVDLSEVRDLEGLDGRRIDIEGGVGRIEVIVPDDLTVNVWANVGLGRFDIMDEVAEGPDLTMDMGHSPRPGTPFVQLDIQLGVGEIVVREQ